MRLSQLSVMIEFELRDCDISLNCQRTFNTHVYVTSSVNATAARNTNNYRQVQRVSPSSITGTRENITIAVNFNTNNSSFYFAIQDETTCIVVTRLLVFYHICPKQTVNLIQYPEIIAPGPELFGQSLAVNALCAMNAEPMGGSASLVLSCAAGGVWSRMPLGAGCRCVAGYFRSNEMCQCECIYTLILTFTIPQPTCTPQ